MVDVKNCGESNVTVEKLGTKMNALVDIQILVMILQAVAGNWVDNNKNRGRRNFWSKQLVRVFRSIRFLEPPTR